MTNPTLERAARAVSDAFPLTNGADAYAQPPQFKLGDKTCLDIVRAVLMAVREPDEETRWKMAESCTGDTIHDTHFTAMIDAILRKKNDAS